MNKNVLLTGGAGYIGSHTVVALIEAGYNPCVLDNFSNSDPKVFCRIRELTGKMPIWSGGNVLDGRCVVNAIKNWECESVIHFAGVKAVGEGEADPLKYFSNNVSGTINLLQSMRETGCKNIVFSSSATVYTSKAVPPIREETPLAPANVYGRTKLMCEDIIRAYHRTVEDDRCYAILRYFNPVGAHDSGLIGENPRGIPNNLMPFVTGVASGRLEKLSVFGNDYETVDGTGVRDYLHVMDLAEGHVAALDALSRGNSFSCNLGTGKGTSVLEMVDTFSRVNGVKIPCTITLRRPGDVDKCWADASLAKEILGWESKRDLEDMCRDAWNWQKNNPEGYSTNMEQKNEV